MSAIHRRMHRAMILIVATILGLTMMAPMVTVADTNLVAGDTAVVTTGGGDVTVRSDASPDAEPLGSIPNGSEVFIVAGPFTAADGTAWYEAGNWELTGYISASMLDGSASAASQDEAPADAPAASSIPWKTPTDYGVVVDNSSEPLPADGLACRVDADSNADVITRLWVGQSVEVTDDSVWVQGVEFLPINCQGQGGFVKADYVVLEREQQPAAPVAEEPAAEEAVAEEPAADETVAEEPAAEEPVVENEAPAPAAPVAGDLIVTVVDQNGQAVAGACFDIHNAAGYVGSACDSNDAIPNNGNSGFFGLAEGGYTLIATAGPGGVAIPNQEAWVTAGGTSYATVSVTVSAPEAAAPTEERATTEAPVTQQPAATENPAPTEEPVVTEEPSATQAPAETPAPTEAPATEAPATEAPAETPAGPDLSRALGDATVTGTNGEGVRCRVAPDTTSATITVLPEGATVFVLENPAGGFLGVACGNQLGYVDVNFMWAGGAGDEIPASASSVVVVGTGGMALNCRSGAGTQYGVIATVAQGSVLTTRGASSNGWAPVVCGGKNGFVSIAFIEVTGGGTTPTTTTPTSPTTAGTGKVTGTNGDGLRCRTAPYGAVIMVVAEGTVLQTRGQVSNGWVPVVCGSQNGYVAAQYFTVGSSSTPTTPTPTPTPGTTSPTSGFVKVTGTNGASLNCRSAASLSGMVITAIPYGSTVAVRGATTNGWVPVTCVGKAGYVSASYVTATTSPGTTTPTPSPTPTPSTGTGTARVVNTDGTGLRCRTAPNGTVITVVAEGTTVTTRGASSGGWTPVICGGRDGYMSSAYLSTGSGTTNPTPTPSPTPSPTPGTGSGIANGDHVRVDSRANLRYQASMSANVMLVVEAGQVLLATGTATNGFIPVDYDGLKGFMYADLLTETTAALSERGGSATSPDPAPAPGSGSATGSSIANYAMRYVGYPYVWATHGPSSFDCSGFTYWVTKNVLGVNIGTGLWTQWSAGTAVSRSNLQPGDLVFFQNTYKAGLSHVGIYIGNNQFVHAENENTGVRVSDLNSTYYSSRWLGARRLG